MATESRSPFLVPVLVHALGIALGLYLGFVVMEAISPDLPDPDTNPGVAATAPASVSGGDPDSLLRAQNLGPALEQLDDQLAAGEGIGTLRIAPGALDAQPTSADGAIDPDEVEPSTPSLLISEIAAERDLTLDDVSHVDLIATDDGPRWYVQLEADGAIGPPLTYAAPLSGTPLTAGRGRPEQID